MTDLTTQTPVEIDTALAEVLVRLGRAQSHLESAERHLADAKKAVAESPSTTYLKRAVESGEQRVAMYQFAVQNEQAKAAPFHAEFDRRGGWTRAFKVTNAGGHIHRSTACQTCFVTTSFAWLPQVSGSTEAEIIDLAGAGACTVCYPNAPVDRPCRLFTADEQAAQAERDAKAAAKVEREAKRLEKALLPSGEPLKVDTGSRWPESLKTLVAGRTWLTDAAWWTQARGSHPSYPASAVAVVAEAVAAKEGKTVEAVLAEAAKRAAKRK